MKVKHSSIPLLAAVIGTAFGCAPANEASGNGNQAVTAAQCANATPWAAGVAYTQGEVVTYSGSTYECVQAHTSEPGWTPDAVASLWAPVSCAGVASGGGGGSAGSSGGGSSCGTGGAGADAGTAGGSGGAGGAGSPDAGTSGTGSAGGGGNTSGTYDRIGYFAQWGIYSAGFPVKSVDTTGEASKLTVINYAFENIDPVNLTCLTATKASGSDGTDPNQGTGAGDQFADYSKSFTADQSVDGVADTYSQTLRGNFNQLKKLKVKYPNLKVLVSIGGWTYSKFFSDVSASDASRKKFVASCIDTYIHGNLLTTSDGAGGPGVGAGVFDGFDLDWEWPAGDTGHPGNDYSAADKTNYGLLMTEFRSELDALGGEHYILSAFLPADPAKIAAGIDLPVVFKALDWGDVQGYDFHGSWEPTQTNHAAALYDTPGDPSPSKFSGDIAINAYLSAGVPANKITLGMPLYGYGWTGVPAGSQNGLYQTATGVAQGAVTPGTNDAKILLPQFSSTYHDTAAVASWGYDGTNFWSFDDAWVIGQKAAYVKAKGLRGAMLWELDGDDGTLVGALDNGLK